jgi:tetratricopeptide (TPR) repeat protein
MRRRSYRSFAATYRRRHFSLPRDGVWDWQGNNLANKTRNRGDYAAAVPIYNECLAMSRELDYPGLTATALMNLAENTRRQGDATTARTLFEQALTWFRTLDEPSGIAPVLSLISTLADAEEAETFCNEALVLYRKIGEKEGIASVLGRLAGLHARRNDRAMALALYQESLILGRELGDRRQIVRAFVGLARLALASKEPERGVFLLAAAAHWRETIWSVPLPEDKEAFEQAHMAARNALDAQTFTHVWEQGQAAPPEQILTQLLAIPVMLS